MTYPDTREVDYHYGYGTDAAIDEVMSRLSAIFDDADDDGVVDAGEDVYASYKYLGAGRIVTEDYEEIEVDLDYTGTNNDFSELDRFGRVVDQVWEDYGSSSVRDRYTYTYDRMGNRTARDNELHAAFDETYTYDGLYRLTNTVRADTFDQSWTLDGLGNWGTFDDDGTSQTRTANEANEITGINGSSNDVDHDAAGNMIRVPKLDGSGDHFHLVYDAWNRLVKVYDDNGTTLIAEYQYDGLGRRIVKGVDDDSNGTLDTFTHFFHNRDNQVLETRQGDDVSGQAPAAETLEPKHQNIWSPRYIDSLILRDECDAGGQIITANRIYYLNDANYNVTALLDANGAVVERYLYTPYGAATVLDPDFTPDADGKSDYDNTTLYTGREFDPETELMYYRARYYHTELGRFVARDPIGYAGGDVNLYAYAQSDPVSIRDSHGLRASKKYPVIDSGSTGPNKKCCDDKAKKLEGGWIRRTVYGSKLHCGKLKKWKKNPGSNLPRTADGATICCDGKPIVCVWADRNTLALTIPNKDARIFIASCINDHEQVHANDMRCNPKKKGFSEGSYPGGRRGLNASECKAYKAQEECLLNSLKKLFDDKATGWDDAFKQVLPHWKSAYESAQTWCNKAGLPGPPLRPWPQVPEE